MKLQELKGVKWLKDLDSHGLVRFMDEYTPYKKAGSGNFSHVFEKDGKIYKFWIMDPAYEAFVKYCQQHTGNEHLPKFLSKQKTLTAFHRRHKNFPNKINYIQMEKLEYRDKFPRRYFEDLKFALREKIINGRDRAMAEFLTDLHERGDSKLWIGLTETITDAVDYLEKHVKGFGWDLKVNNVLWRGPVPVLTDPGIEDKSTDELQNLKDLDIARRDQQISGRSSSKDAK